MVVAGADERVQHVEGGAFADHGLDVGGWIGRLLTDVLPPRTHAALMPHYRAALAGEPQSFRYETLDEIHTYWVRMAPVRDHDGVVQSVVAVMEDIAERERVTTELERSEARLHEAERMVGVGSWEVDLPTGQVTFSPGFARLFGLDPAIRLTVSEHRQYIHPEDREAVQQAGEACLHAGSATCEYRIVRPDGKVRILLMEAELGRPDESIGKPGHARYMHGAVLDVTDQRADERKSAATEHLYRQGFEVAPIAMAVSDPGESRLVRVNEAFCRLVGRTREELVGAEIPSISHPDDRTVSARARAAMREGGLPYYRAETRYLKPDGSVVWAELHVSQVRQIDGTLAGYHSQIVDITERKEREQRLEHDVADAAWLGRIRDALDEDRLVLYAQPIVDLTTGETVQQELLLRMREPDGTIVGPGEFLPVAERYGLISEIDRWVIRQAVQIAAGGAPAEFNLSARSVGDPSIVRELASALAQTGADPSLLVVEVTETAFAGRMEAGREFAREVRALGCRVALDDFGTGFSSLSYLKHLPADHLKIDIEFVRELARSETDLRVVRGIVSLAREFNQLTVAEGVEDADTLLLLRELGVDLAQGYLFGKPAPRGDAPETAPATPRPRACGCEDPVEIVRAAFAAFADRDIDAMLRHCRQDIVLRSLQTSKHAGRSEPYRGHAGIRQYVSDVATVWDRLTFTPLTFRRAQDAVIGFGRTEAHRGEERELASLMWVIRVEDGQLASLEVFRAADDGSMSESQIQRLAVAKPD